MSTNSISDPANPCLNKAHSSARSMVLAGKPQEEIAAKVYETTKKCDPPLSGDQLQTVIQLAELERLPDFAPQDYGTFMARHFPPKESLIEGVLNTRDQISLTGRRRHGKTTFVSNLVVAGASG